MSACNVAGRRRPLIPFCRQMFLEVSSLRYAARLHRDWKRAKIDKYFLSLNAFEHRISLPRNISFI